MKYIILFILCFPILNFAQENGEKEQIRMFYLGGQSNMDGYGQVAELPDSLNKTFENVWIFHGNAVEDENISGGRGVWEKLSPGHGGGFSSDGKVNTLSERFGLELSFANTLQSQFPGEKIALIKFSRGGSSIDSLAASQFGSWEPDYKGRNGINQYDSFLATINNATAVEDIDGNGQKDQLIPSGILWMQGESDAAHSEKVAHNYYHNLTRLMDLIQASLRKDDLPIIIGKISDSGDNEFGKVWKYGELVQAAQEKYVDLNDNAKIVRSTKNYQYSDAWHYNSAAYIDLGIQFAQALLK